MTMRSGEEVESEEIFVCDKCFSIGKEGVYTGGEVRNDGVFPFLEAGEFPYIVTVDRLDDLAPPPASCFVGGLGFECCAMESIVVVFR